MRGHQLPILILMVGTAVGLTLLSPFTWIVLLTDGVLALAIVAAAAGWGAWPTAWLGFRRYGTGQQVCIATALGLGLLSLFTLTLGVAGLLSHPVAWTLLAIGGICGLTYLYRAQSKQGTHESTPSSAGAPSFAQQRVGALIGQTLLLTLLIVPLVIALFAASLPPGMLWQAEANGYDVLEYHLQGPREYYDAGRITFLPHNVYTSFPQQMEMLYLLLMHLAGSVYAAAIPAQLLHASCGILAVIALGCWAGPGWPRWLVVLLAGSTPWLAYLGCLAYVENGMLLFAAVAAGLIIDHYRERTNADWRTALTAGLCAGLAGGCKYTALVFVALALELAWLTTMRASFKLRAQRIAIYGIGVLLAFSPWLIRNAAFTGNPVHPFAHEWFGGRAWSADQARQWSAGHRLPSEHDSFTGRLTLAARELFGSVTHQTQTISSHVNVAEHEIKPSLFGQVIFVLALAGVVIGRSRRAAMLTLWSGLILLGWISLTFIPGRFAVPLIVPLALLGGECLAGDRSHDGHPRRPWLKWIVVPIAIAGVLVNDISLAGRLREHNERWTTRAGVPLHRLLGQTDIFVDAHLLNETLPSGAYAWLVGDAAVFYVDREIHYTVPFSRDPWLEFAATAAPRSCLDWLRGRDVSHVVFSWKEIERLRQTYGFPDIVTHKWVARLEQAGLRRVEIEPPPTGVAPVEIYELPPIESVWIRPSLSTIMRLQRFATFGSCVTTTIVIPAAFSSSSMSRMTRPVLLSRLPVGSSASNMTGSFIRARAIATRCCWPPESSFGLWCSRSVSSTRWAIRRARWRRMWGGTPW